MQQEHAAVACDTAADQSVSCQWVVACCLQNGVLMSNVHNQSFNGLLGSLPHLDVTTMILHKPQCLSLQCMQVTPTAGDFLEVRAAVILHHDACRRYVCLEG
jgi:hypothetical protein